MLKRHGVLVAFVAFVVVYGATVFFLHNKEAEEFAQNAQASAHLAEQQRIFAEWFAVYQKDIDELSRNWQIYHHIIDTFKTADIDLYTCYERLNRLAADEEELTNRIENRNLPPELDEFLYAKTKSLRDKMRDFAAAQYKTVALSRAAADPDAVRGETREEQSRDIEQIMIRESPTALFIAEEVFAVREYLSPVNASAKTPAPGAEESPRE